MIIGADNRPLMLLRQEFPEIPFIRFPGYHFSYPASSQMAIKMFLQTPRILLGIKKEHQQLDKIITKHGIDLVFSDNRFGLYNKQAFTVFMTHQIQIQTPPSLGFLKPLLYRQNKRFIKRFNECWIPDFEGSQNLSGMLSHGKGLPESYHFIGPQTRFNKPAGSKSSRRTFEIVAMLSGPEPQRTMLENILKKEILSSGKKAAMVLGKPELSADETKENNLKIFNHLDAGDLQQLILDSEIIISRPGYSTLMDLSALQKKAIFIPTPGQTEQEYLANHCEQQGLCFWMPQNKFDLNIALEQTAKYHGLNLANDPLLLENRIESVLSKL